MLRSEIKKMEYNRLSDYLKKRFGTKVYRISLQTGCSCPNRDGTIGIGGCTFCSGGGSGEFASPLLPIREQIEIAKKQIDQKFPKGILPKDRKYIAYYQSFTNTYGETEALLELFRETILQPEVAVLSIATRPDCISDAMLSGLSELNKIKPVWIELGLQTIHEKTAERIHRGFRLNCFEETYQRLKSEGLEVIVHIILGLPKETKKEILQTAAYLGNLQPGIDGIKIQLLHILKGTQLEEEYQKDPFPILSLEKYCELVTDCLKLIPRETVIHRITGDGDKKLLVEPLWSGNKKVVLNTLNRYIREH